MLLLGLVSLTAMPYAVLMPVFADQILHGGPRALGLLMGASGLGALGGAVTLAMKKSIRGLGKWIAIACCSFGAFLILFAYSRRLWLSMVLLVPTGFSLMLQMASSNTLVQSMVPDQLRGRTMAVYSMMFMGMAPFGSLLSGSLAHGVGAPLTVAFGGMISIVGGIVFGLRWSAHRPLARELVVAQQMSGGAPAQEMTARVFQKGSS